MSDQQGRYRYSGNDPQRTRPLSDQDVERTQVERAWTEDFGDYREGEPYSADDAGFGPSERSGTARSASRSRRVHQPAIDPAEQTRTEARYEETGYVSQRGQAYQRDPRFDSDGGPRRQSVRLSPREDDQAPMGYSLFTLVLASLAALTIGVVGTILMGGLGNSSSSTPTAVSTIDPNAATPDQIKTLNDEVAKLTATIQERDAQIHNIQTELDRVRQESAANNAAATSASQQAAEAEQRKAALDAREAELNKQAEDLNALAEQLRKREADLRAGNGGGTLPKPIEDAASGAVDQAAGAASEGLNNVIDQIRQSLGN
ncbi:hypothetical protein [Stomatohabitans albus]|uniref:hypothetical protein n=1 Tax=Stomatohabitans albus TaxID=3110766 RepID=UPI00300C2D18